MIVPTRFAELMISRAGRAGRQWIEALPTMAAELLDRWACVESGPVMHGFTSVVVPAVRADAAEVVLKLAAGDTAEPVALAAWNGVGAVRLLERDDVCRAMLLERLQPLTEPVSFAEVGRLAHRLAIAAPPGLPSLADKAVAWARAVPAHAARLGHPLPKQVLDACVANARELAADQAELLVHGDLHPGNIMCGDGELRAIDPTGLVGDSAFEVLPVLRGDWPQVVAELSLRRAVEWRIAEFAEAAEVDRERVRRWTQARAAESALWSRDLQEPESVTAVVDSLAALLA